MHLGASAGPGEVFVSVKDLAARSGSQYADRGVAELEGVPGEWRRFAVERNAATDRLQDLFDECDATRARDLTRILFAECVGRLDNTRIRPTVESAYED